MFYYIWFHITKYELGIIVGISSKICKLIDVIVYILIINSHDVDIPDITILFKAFNLISTFCSFHKCSHVLLPLDKLRCVLCPLFRLE